MKNENLNKLKPFMNRTVDKNNRQIFMTRSPTPIDDHQRIGEYNFNSCNTYMQINKYNNCDNIGVMMISLLPDGEYKYYQKLKTRYTHFLDGAVKSPYDRSVCQVGYLGEGLYSPSSNHRIYNIWKHMLTRCMDSYVLIRPSYLGVQPDPYFYSFQNFAKWYEVNFYEINNERMDLEKDILFKGNRIYSPNTCCFVPQSINTVFTLNDNCRGNLPLGVIKDNDRYIAKVDIYNKQIYLGTFLTPEKAFFAYKEAKETEIKRIANDYWYNKGGMYIPQFKKVYDAMMNYQVEITD